MFQFNLGFGGVTAPMEYPQDQQRTPREPLPEFPDIKDTSVGTLRLAGTLDKRLPSMPGGSFNDLAFSDARRLAAEQYANDMRASYDVSRAYDQRNRAVAKARARQNDRQLKNSDSQGRITRRQLQGRTKRSERSTILRNARDYLGMGTDMFR